MPKAKLCTAGMYPAERLPNMVYIVNRVPVFAVAINEYEVKSMTKETLAVLRSRRGEVVSLLLVIVEAVLVLASAFGTGS